MNMPFSTWKFKFTINHCDKQCGTSSTLKSLWEKSCFTIINKSYNKTIFGLLMFELILLYHQVKLIALIISLHFISMPFYIDWSNRFKNYNVFWYLLGFNWWSRIECFVSTYCKFLTLWYLYLRYSTKNFAWLLLVAIIVMWKYLLFCQNFMVFICLM